jgi:hypothetical protein
LDGDKEKDESIFKLETPHPTKDNNNHEQPRIDYIESWFQSIVGQAMQSYFGHIQLNSYFNILWACFSLLDRIPDMFPNSGVHSTDQLDA